MQRGGGEVGKESGGWERRVVGGRGDGGGPLTHTEHQHAYVIFSAKVPGTQFHIFQPMLFISEPVVKVSSPVEGKMRRLAQPGSAKRAAQFAAAADKTDGEAESRGRLPPPGRASAPSASPPPGSGG